MKSALRRGGRTDLGEPGIVWLDDPQAAAAELAGAKAAALARAKAAGLPVLPGLVVTTAFDRESSGHLGTLRDAWCTISHGGELSLVVRSSSTIEDNATTSMAGMFTSVLDVGGWEQFLFAIDTVLASGNVVPLVEGPRAAGRAPMAVLVQPYLAARTGGVLFGLDPVSGREDRLVVSATERGPAALVSGEVDGVRYVLTHRGRLVEGPASPGPLSRHELRHLARVARRADHLFGGPQDIEWAFDQAGTFRLLQSRPVTARGQAGHATAGPTLGPGPVAETFPDPLLPLEEDLWAEPLRDALREALGLAASSSRRRLERSPVLVSVGGRLAVDLDVFPGARRSSSVLSRLDPRPPLRRLHAAWRVGRLRAALPALAADLVERADADLLAVDGLDGLADGELVGLLRSSRRGLASLHGHEVLMGWLVQADGSSVAAASVALRLLAAGRGEGLSDEEIVARDPGVLALVPPAVGPGVVLPPTPETLPAGAPAPGPAADDPAVLREALRLRARWVQEVTARAAWELGRRLAARGRFDEAAAVRMLRLDELETAVRTGAVPADLDARRPPTGAPLPARFRLSDTGAVVAVDSQAGATGRAQGAGGGRGAGLVHDGSGVPPEGAVLVVRTLDPGLAAVLPRLGGLVAETGSPLSHLAILARELGVPTVVGVEDATTRFPAGSLVVVDGTTGEASRIDKERGAA